MTLSKAEWRAVRPDKLRTLDAAKLMEALRRKPGDRIEDWQDFLADCDELERVLDRTPRMLLKTMTGAFRAALVVWHRDIADLRRDGHRRLEELARAHVDSVCSAIAAPHIAAAQELVETVRAHIKDDKKRKGTERDRKVQERLAQTMKAQVDTLRALRRDKMRMPLKDDRMAQELIRTKVVRMGRFRMTCDPVMKGLMRALGELQKQMDRLANADDRTLRDAGA
ncbi:MAG: hypothetical protein ACT4OK_12925 [Gemmobacter sp.]